MAGKRRRTKRSPEPRPTEPDLNGNFRPLPTAVRMILNHLNFPAAERRRERNKLDGHDARRGYAGAAGGRQKLSAQNDEQHRRRQPAEASSKRGRAATAQNVAVVVVRTLDFPAIRVAQPLDTAHAANTCCAINKFSYRSFQII